MNKFLLLLLATTFSISVVSQEMSLKEQALAKFKSEHYHDAISLLEQALKQSPNDAEIYYYLGWFNHYNAYDSRPLKGYNYDYSDQIFKYLDKAIELNPNYGDARYFYSAECGSRAMYEMQKKNAENVKYYYELAFKKGGFPDWLIEYGKNCLSSCNENAIFFVGGDADFNVCSYLQICKKFRTDVTLIPLGYLDRPWFVNYLKNGFDNVAQKINLSLTENQIMNIRPFKWRETDVFINISPTDRLKYGLTEDSKMQWTVAPDMQSWRMHSKIEGEEAARRTFLSPQRAILLQIIEDNFAERPIYFTNAAEATFYGGLNEYFQNCGLISMLMPIKTKDTKYQVDALKLEQLFQPENFTHFAHVKENDFPRISRIVIYGYPSAVIELANYYLSSNMDNNLQQLIDFYRNHLIIGYNKEYEQLILNELENLK